MEAKRGLSTKEAAEFLNNLGVPVSPGTLEVWRCYGRGPRFRKVSRWCVYAPTDLEAFARGRVVETVDSRECRTAGGLSG